MLNFANISTKLTLAIATMGLLTAIAIANGLLVFQQVGGQVQTVNEVRMPEIQAATDLKITTAGFAKRLTRIIGARNAEDLTPIPAEIAEISTESRAILDRMDGTTTKNIAPLVEGVSASLLSLTEAQRTAFQNKAEVLAQIEGLRRLNADLFAILEREIDEAYAELVVGGETATAEVGRVFDTLVERDFKKFQLALRIRAEVNLLSGFVIAMKETSDPSFRASFRDLAAGASARLNESMAAFSEFDINADALATISEADAFFQRELARSPTEIGAGIAEIVFLRKGLEETLAGLISFMDFNLILDAQSAQDANTATIESLLENQVGRIQRITA
ncbi:MAG: hypothetical protein AAF568_11110, partial [Pseudomonadota bacterium]